MYTIFRVISSFNISMEIFFKYLLILLYLVYERLKKIQMHFNNPKIRDYFRPINYRFTKKVQYNNISWSLHFYEKSCQCSHENEEGTLQHFYGILEYFQIARNVMVFKIPYIKSHSSNSTICDTKSRFLYFSGFGFFLT